MKYKKILINILIIIILLSIVLIGNKLFIQKNNRYNISSLSNKVVEEYFEEISKLSSDDEKETMLIVISDNKIKDSYGAANIIEAPNHQYILQYNSKEEKELALEQLKEDKRIDSVEENGFYTTEVGNYNSWGIEQMALDYAITSTNDNGLNMQQITVAVIDTGCDISLFNKYYGGKIVEFYNVLDQSTTIMTDEDGHGTHVAGTIAEGTPDNVKILPIKVSKDGKMYYSDVIAAINYVAYNNKAQVINMSFGGYGYNEALDQAIEAAKEKNIISVAAAGNNNTAQKHYPSSLENTISIASVDSNLNKSTFSNYGSEILFTAPGTNIKSIMGKDTAISRGNGNNDDDDHEIISGTSMATPHAASAVAILKSYNKNLTLENVIDILKDNAQDLGEEGWDQYYGNGLISFNNVVFCDGTYCDELGIYKDLSKSISSIELVNLNLTQYNYYTITNLMGSIVNVHYTDNTNEELAIGELPNIQILNYDPNTTNSQTVTIKVGNLSTNVQVTNPNNYESGWEYNTLENGRLEITGYKNNNLGIKRLYVPETINSKYVVAFADNFKFAESGDDIEAYSYLYLPSNFTRIGNYSLAGTNIKYVYGENNEVDVGAHAFENSKIVSIDMTINKIEDYAFKDCLELSSIEVSNNNALIIGNYAFYNCKKLATVKMPMGSINHIIGDIGNYAFYNCISLSYFDLEPGSDIGNYAFYNTLLLYDIDLYNSISIGNHAFHGSAISELDFSIDFEVINESAFENCKNLKDLSFNGGRIESRAFWGSGIETVFLNNVEYIAEDAFAYSPIKKDNGIISSGGTYQVLANLGIVENGNKLLVGFTNVTGTSNATITENITEIGDYAFTGNNNLNKITIPANVTKIGDHAFEDCYQLSDVYMLGNSINFGNDTFKRNYEGEIAGVEFKIYVHKDSSIKQFVKSKNLNYRHIEPDAVIVTNYEDTYSALSYVDLQTLGVKLLYHEEEDREEILDIVNYGMGGVGFNVFYQTENANNFQYGDTYFIVKARNEVGYLSIQNVEVTVEKITPTYVAPTGLTANFGQTLSEIVLPEHFEWMNENQIIAEFGEVIYKAKYIPEDTNNYETIENINVVVTVNNTKTIVNPEITVSSKVYDGTTTIPISNVTISNLDNSEYSVVSILSSSADAGVRTATIILRLSNEKFENYAFSNGQQEKEFVVSFEIMKANINITDNSENVTVKYDGNSHSVEINIVKDSSAIIKYMDSNNEYTLDEVPSYADTGTYTTKYKVYINDNYTEYFGQKTLTIEDEVSYTINKYNVDETNKYIGKIMVNTEVNSFTSNIILGYGYGIDVDTKTIDNKQLLYTGGKTRITHGLDLYMEYTNVVVGDLNGDGRVNSADLLQMRKHLLEEVNLTGAYKEAGIIESVGNIKSLDLLRLRQYLLDEYVFR